MTAHQSTIAKIKSLVKNLPELCHIAAACASDINKVNGNNALIESAVILFLALNIILCSCDIADSRLGKSVGSKERTATHRSINIAFKVEHNLFADIIGHHSLCGALSGKFGKIEIFRILVNIIVFKNINKFRKCGSNPYSALILNALNSLLERFLNNKSKVFLLLLVLCLVKVHKHCNERSLTVCCKKGNNLILNGLNAS